MSDSDSDSMLERVLGKNYSFLRHSLKNDIAKTSTPEANASSNPGKKDEISTETETVLADTSASTSAAPSPLETETTKEMPTGAIARYANLSLEKLISIAERVRFFSEVGVVVPEKTVPCRNKSKPKNKKQQQTQPVAKKRKNTHGNGSVGATCSSYGVRRCLCCNDNNDNILGAGEFILDRFRFMTEQWMSSSMIDSSAAHLSPSREIPRHTLATSTPLSAIAQEASLSSDSDVSEIRNTTPNRNAQTETQSEEHIMEYVNDLLGDTGNSIEAEVEERYQRLHENRLAASDAISNAITVSHSDEIDFDHSVILVGESSPQPILIEDSVVEVNEVSHNSPKKSKLIDITDEPSERTDAVEKKDGKSMQRTRECPICVEELANKDISATTCGHVFCTECIRAAVKVSKLCPICRTKLTQSKIHRLYCLL